MERNMSAPDRIGACLSYGKKYAQDEDMAQAHADALDEYAALRQENDTLRKALDKIERYEVDWTQGVVDNVEAVKEIARLAAVSPKGEA